MTEVGLERSWLVPFTCDEISDVFHSTTPADVLEVDRGNESAASEAEVRELGVAMDERSMGARSELCVEERRDRSNRSVHRAELVSTRREMPIRSHLPESRRRLTVEGRVEGSEPCEASIERLRISPMTPFRKAR